ncbi:cell wall-binding repeat-containing protein [Herbiconiux liangxiaofengii]|uniref:cell wall-binding repeat-containing protein n=1 Tax=Herbiconiux liangxiaofengii TaxID=3342795 RepID=UPI0035B8776E
MRASVLTLTARRCAAAAGVLALGAALLVPGASQAAEAAQPAPEIAAGAAVMPSILPGSFDALASELPPALAAAVERDLGEEPSEYLARSAAADAASDVLAALASEGMNVSASRLDGTELVVTVSNDVDAARVQAAGARAEVGDPADAAGYDHLPLRALADLEGGQPFTFSTFTGSTRVTYACSAAFNGVDVTSRQSQLLTAGHCIAPDRTDGGVFFDARQTSAGTTPYRNTVLGSPLESAFRFGSGMDSGLIATAATWNPLPVVATWGGAAGALGDGDPVVVRDTVTSVAGAPICKSGRQTGWTCGEILATNVPSQVYNRDGAPVIVNLTLTSACMLAGDSGSAAVVGTSALGVGSSGSFDGDCVNPTDGEISAFFSLRTDDGSASVATANPGWEPIVAIDAPVVKAPVFVGDSIRGVLPGGGPRHRMTVKIDGVSTFTATPDSEGAWAVPVPASLSSGRHDFSVQASWGTSVSTVVAGEYRLAPRPNVERIAGPDRYAVAAAVAQAAFPGTAPTVLLATGANYPDALSAGPAAVKLGGPLLLTSRDALPAVTASELRRLRPSQVIVVGGPASVSEDVLAAVRDIVPDTIRLSGADRYEASRTVVDYAFSSAATAYLATGANFPDALSASAAAGSQDAPVVLVDGGAAGADQPTLTLLDRLKIRSATVAGGPNSVSTGIEASLAARYTTVRQSGADRYAASVNINKAAFTTSSTVYLATGLNYPDALAGGVLAGLTDSPLFVVPTTCVPGPVLAQIRTLGATDVVLLGGPVSLSGAVEKLVPCI